MKRSLLFVWQLLKQGVSKVRGRFNTCLANRAEASFNKSVFGKITIPEKNTRSFWITVFVGYFFVLLIGIWFSQYSSEVIGETWNWGEFTLLATILYTAASLRIIGPSDIGVRLFFGRPIDQVGSGITFVPFVLCALGLFSNLMQQAELPSEPENIYDGGENDPDGKNIPDGKFPPIRIVFGGPKNDKTTDPYDHRMAVKVTPVIRYRIMDTVKFIRTIGSWKEARRQIEDAVIATLNEEFSQISPAEALRNLPAINEKLGGKNGTIDQLVAGWGVELESLRVKPFGFSHKLNSAVAAVPIATQEKKSTIIKAEAKKQELVLDGKGRGAAEQSVIKGRTAGLKHMAETLGVGSLTVLNADTARVVTQNPGQKTVVLGSGGFADLMGIATAVGETLKPQPSPPQGS